LGDFQLVKSGEPLAFDAIAAHNWLAAAKEVKLEIDLGIGQAEATVWTCDLSYKYVEINAEYHT
jgi:glutamate N-acetyltransferase/amino-acid N-acetyltransferase